MKVLALATLTIVLLSTSLAGWHVLIGKDVLVVGGTYVLRSGESIGGDLVALSAQVTVEQEAHITGGIRAISSVLDLAGRIDGGVSAAESDLVLRDSARIAGGLHETQAIHYVILVPRLALAGAASGTAR